ncbi:rod shape-determining protein MreC [Thermopolyspora sp. NPDC052614]|uniref:rod shape-determining protein MreC n=1 Tax=Thermopolyspora sp. NPDC052614 TaxID=3155682 RepID=UPI00342A8CF1
MRLTRRHRLVLAAVAALAAALITFDVRGDASALRQWAASVAGPVQRLVVAARDSAPDERRVRLAATGWAGSAAADRDRQAEAVTAAARHARSPVVTAQVIAYGTHGDTVAVDVGTRDGVRAGQMVLNADGLVGMVVESGHSVATVRLAADPAAGVGVRVSGSREIGVVTGRGVRDGLLRLRLLAGDATLRIGARVETLGSAKGGPYLPGVPVGTVARLERETDPLVTTALVRPAVRFTTLDVVGVVTSSDGDRHAR